MNWQEILKKISEAQFEILPIVFLWSITTNMIRAMRWRVLLLGEKKDQTASRLLGQHGRVIWQ
jgi:hypothetical protein